MLIGRLLALALLGVSASAQLNGSTILQILNTTQLSPATKFVELLTSSPEFQPLLQQLSSPGNQTLFVPSDEVWQELEQQQQNSTSGGANGGGQSQTAMPSATESTGVGGGSGGSGQQQPTESMQQQPTESAQQQPTGMPSGSQNGGSGMQPEQSQPQPQPEQTTSQPVGFGLYGMWVRLKGQVWLQQDQSGNGGSTSSGMMPSSTANEGGNGGTGGGMPSMQSGASGSGMGNMQPSASASSQGAQSSSSMISNGTNPFMQGPLANFSVTDVIRYHLLNGTYFLRDLQSNTTIVPTELMNTTVDRVGGTGGSPLIITRNDTQQQGASEGQNPSASTSAMVGGSTSDAGQESSNPSSSVDIVTSSVQQPAQQTGGQSDTGQQQPQQSQAQNEPPAQDEGDNGGDGGFSWYRAMEATRAKFHPHASVTERAFAYLAAANNVSTGLDQEAHNYTVGNGLESANVTLKDIVASNGVIHVIDKGNEE